MNYFALSETEYNALQAVRGQLNLVSGLLCAVGAESSLFDASDLNDFVSKQVDDLRAVIRALDARYEAQRDERKLNWLDWTYALKIASGDAIHTPRDAGRYVLDGLVKASLTDEDFGSVITLWIELLDKQKSTSTHAAIAKKPAPRKRDKLVSKARESV